MCSNVSWPSNLSLSSLVDKRVVRFLLSFLLLLVLLNHHNNYMRLSVFCWLDSHLPGRLYCYGCGNLQYTIKVPSSVMPVSFCSVRSPPLFRGNYLCVHQAVTLWDSRFSVLSLFWIKTTTTTFTTTTTTIFATSHTTFRCVLSLVWKFHFASRKELVEGFEYPVNNHVRRGQR